MLLRLRFHITEVYVLSERVDSELMLLVEVGPMGVIKLNHGQILKKYFFHDF